MNSPLVSIVIPVYNIDQYLSRCIDSCMKQTYRSIEIILVDDGSTDSSGSLCDSYAQKDKRIRVLHKQNEGVARARLTGFDASSGDYITFVDGDDYIDIHFVEILVAAMQDTAADFVWCNYYDVFADGSLRLEKQSVSGVFEGTEKEALYAMYLYNANPREHRISNAPWKKLLKRNIVRNGLLKGIGLKTGEDHVCVYQWLLDSQCCSFIPDALYFYCHRGDSLSHKTYDNFAWLPKLLELDNENGGYLAVQVPYFLFSTFIWSIVHSTTSYNQIRSYITFFLQFCTEQKIQWGGDLSIQRKTRLPIFCSVMVYIAYYMRFVGMFIEHSKMEDS